MAPAQQHKSKPPFARSLKSAPRIDADAFALQPVRVDQKRDEFIYYEATTFPANPHSGCQLRIRRLWVLGYLRKPKARFGHNLILDVLNKNGDVIQDFEISKAGFEYLRRSLRFRREQS